MFVFFYFVSHFQWHKFTNTKNSGDKTELVLNLNDEMVLESEEKGPQNRQQDFSTPVANFKQEEKISLVSTTKIKPKGIILKISSTFYPLFFLLYEP